VSFALFLAGCFEDFGALLEVSPFFLAFSPLGHQLFVPRNHISDELPHGLISDNMVKVDVFKLLGLQLRCRPVGHFLHISSFRHADLKSFVTFKTQLLPKPRHSSITWQNSALREFPLSGPSEELLLPELVVRKTQLQFDEYWGVSDSQLNYAFRLLPLAVNVEELENVHLLIQNYHPQYVGGKKVPLSIWHNLARSDHQEQDQVPSNLGKKEPGPGHEHSLKHSYISAID
jgi:hypothetical protein